MEAFPLQDARVLIVSVDAPPRRGGIAAFTHFVASELGKACNAAILLGPRGARPMDGFGGGYEVVQDAWSRPNVQDGAFFLTETRRLTALIRDIVSRRRIDLIVLIHPFYYGPAAVEVARSSKIPVWTAVHGTELTSQFPHVALEADPSQPRPDLPLSSISNRPFNLLSVLQRSDRVIANSEYTREIAKKISPTSNIITSGCGLSEEFLHWAQKELQITPSEKRQARQDRTNPAALQLCFVGRLVPHKRVERIFPLLTETDWELTVIGDGPCLAALRSHAATLGIADRVHFVGVLDDSGKWRTLAQSDFLMLPSSFDAETGGYEGFGIVLLEAVAAGVIPVSSATQGARDPVHVYGLGIEGLSDAVSIEETAQQLRRYFEDDEEYAAKLARDTRTISEKLLWRHVVARMAIGASAA